MRHVGLAGSKKTVFADGCRFDWPPGSAKAGDLTPQVGGFEALFSGLGPCPAMDVDCSGASLPQELTGLARSEVAHDLGIRAGWTGFLGRNVMW